MAQSACAFGGGWGEGGATREQGVRECARVRKWCARAQEASDVRYAPLHDDEIAGLANGVKACLACRTAVHILGVEWAW